MSSITLDAKILDDAALLASVRRSRRSRAFVAWMFVLPAIIYLTVAFLLPIGSVLYKSVANDVIALPKLVKELRKWDGHSVPGDATAQAFFADLVALDPTDAARIGRDLNDRIAGFRTLMIKTRRMADDAPKSGSMDALVSIDSRWSDTAYWQVMRNAARPYTPFYVLSALDLAENPDGSIDRKPEDQRIYLQYVTRTFWICVVVTTLCAAIGYPVAYFISQSSPVAEKLLLFALLIPFWTSVLVRTAAWVIVLQRNGIVNEFLLKLGVIGEPLTMIYNRFGVYVAMTHVLLPFMILPIYSVMKSIPPHYVRAALSLGASPAGAFKQVYLPLSMPGLSAGIVMVFILGLCYYITPALVGGSSDQMESGMIANFALGQANWQMASALSVVLLSMTAVLFFVLKRVLRVTSISLG